MSNNTSLPVLPLQHPLILFPASRVTLPVSKTIGEHILSLLPSSESNPIIAAVPLPAVSPPAQPAYNQWGVAARIVRLVKPTSRAIRQPYALSLHGLTRIKLNSPLPAPPSSPNSFKSLSVHPVTYPPPSDLPAPAAVEAFKASALRLLDRLAKDASQAGRREGWVKIAVMLDEVTDDRIGWMSDVMLAAINGDYNDKLEYLNTHDINGRLLAASTLFQKQAAFSELTNKISQSVDESLTKQQKEYFLRQQLAAIQRELSNLRSNIPGSSPQDAPPGPTANTGSELDDDESADFSDLHDIRSKIECMEQGSEERKMGVREWRRLKRIPSGSVENGVIRSYLEWLTSLPWPTTTTTPVQGTDRRMTTSAFLAAARTQLDADHFGLEKIKRRLIEYLAIVRLKEINAAREHENNKQLGKPQTNRKDKGVKGPILLFVGPPGVGKTSLGQSVAKALGKPFQRISLGGVRDEAEIRGHRRTYVASGPGLIIQALRKAGRNDPVLLLDEIDKVGQSNFHGDPGAALLEVLDPEQNNTFNDHYVNVPFDLSQVLFICTANTLDTISPPLLDRCEVIQLSGYTYDEKMHIARRFLLPKQLQANGLAPSHISISEPALLQIATQYTREAGVRSLERAIGAVVRFKAVEWAEHADDQAKEYTKIVDVHDLEKILGVSRWDGEEREREERRGVVYGLVVTGQGEGGILPVESISVPGSGLLKLTGSLGDVIKESGQLALTWLKTNAFDLCITDTPDQDPMKVPNPIDIHLHLPAGAQKKDGPSAGIAMVCAFVSLLTGACVPANVAMTGEITLRGRVTSVGGIKEKVLGAHRAQITKVILPWANRKDVDHDIASEIRNELEFVFVRSVREALDAAFGKGALMWRRSSLLLESRL